MKAKKQSLNYQSGQNKIFPIKSRCCLVLHLGSGEEEPEFWKEQTFRIRQEGAERWFPRKVDPSKSLFHFKVPDS
jgi:hypothetical protein